MKVGTTHPADGASIKICWFVLNPQITGVPELPVEPMVNVSVTHRPVAPTLFAGVASVSPLIGPAMSNVYRGAVVGRGIE